MTGSNYLTLIPAIAALVSGVSAAAASIIVAVIQSRAQHNAVLSEMSKRDALQVQRIEQLEKKMDKHNQLIERTYKVEEAVKLLEKDIKVADHRLKDLESSVSNS